MLVSLIPRILNNKYIYFTDKPKKHEAKYELALGMNASNFDPCCALEGLL